MNANEQAVLSALEPYGPQLPIKQLVYEVNRLYHDIEAQHYDQRHPEIHSQMPALWEQMLGILKEKGPSEPLRVLDFGCGTGFEADQVLEQFPENSIAELVCYDPSEGMVQQCASRIRPKFRDARFTSRYEEVCDDEYDVIVTNALLHHLPNPLETFIELAKLTSSSGVWLSGHEPSSRFYQNPECASTHGRFKVYQRRHRFYEPSKYWNTIRRKLGKDVDPAKETAVQAVQKGFFRTAPDRKLIVRLVDFYVAHSAEEAAQSRGFDFERMQEAWEGVWSLEWVKSYSFMGDTYEGKLSAQWAEEAKRLSEKYPRDGASFSAVWRRVATA